MVYQIINKRTGFVVAGEAQVAQSFFQRGIGLMFKDKMKMDEALIFYRAPSIHTCFMSFPIDVAFLDEAMRVMKIYPALKPWRLASCFGSYMTVEFPAQTLQDKDTQTGDYLELKANV